MLPSRRYFVPLLILAVLGCSGTTTEPTRARVAGTYLLTSSTPRGGPADGSIILRLDGTAERHVRYPTVNGNLGQWYDYYGTYVFETDSVIVLSFGQSPNIWSIPAAVGDGTLTLSLPNPADGFIDEHYERLSLFIQ